MTNKVEKNSQQTLHIEYLNTKVFQIREAETIALSSDVYGQREYVTAYQHSRFPKLLNLVGQSYDVTLTAVFWMCCALCRDLL